MFCMEGYLVNFINLVMKFRDKEEGLVDYKIMFLFQFVYRLSVELFDCKEYFNFFQDLREKQRQDYEEQKRLMMMEEERLMKKKQEEEQKRKEMVSVVSGQNYQEISNYMLIKRQFFWFNDIKVRYGIFTVFVVFKFFICI